MLVGVLVAVGVLVGVPVAVGVQVGGSWGVFVAVGVDCGPGGGACLVNSTANCSSADGAGLNGLKKMRGWKKITP